MIATFHINEQRSTTRVRVSFVWFCVISWFHPYLDGKTKPRNNTKPHENKIKTGANIVKRTVTFLILVLFLLSFSVGQVPQSPVSPADETDKASTTDASPARAMTAADVEAFLAGILPLQLAREDIAGATVAIVKDGKVLFAKGYGYADVAAKKPVAAEETLFRPGSVSKLFTWTAVMQLHEQGKLDLDRDINEYMDFHIPEAFGQPITLKHILTHTPGFEEQIKDLFAFDKPSPNLGEYLKTHIPRRIYPPGTVPAYSNYGTTLAGYIVERVSGQPFNDYIDQNIFKPLKMTRSTFAQPLPPELAPSMSKGYALGSDDAKPFETIGPFPAGSLSSTSTDLARFMLAHLQQGQLDEAQILKPETARLMHSRLFALDDAANAMCYGFYEESSHGRRIIGHGGDTVQFHSDLHLIPDAGVGFFVSYNSGGKGETSPRTILWEAFLDRYFPDTRPEMPTLETAKQNAAAVTGNYMISRRAEGSFLHSLAILGEAVVSANDDGTVSVNALNDPNGKPKRWREVAPMTFRDVNGQDSLIFKPDDSGQMQLILPFPFMVFKRIGLWQNSSVLLPIAGISLAIMLLTLLFWPLAWLIRRHYGGTVDFTRAEWWLRVGVRIVFALNLIFIIGLVIFIAQVSAGALELFSDAGNSIVMVFQVIGIIGAIGTLVVLYYAVRAWMSSRYRIWGKLQASLFVLACLGFLWFALAANLLRITSTF